MLHHIIWMVELLGHCPVVLSVIANPMSRDFLCDNKSFIQNTGPLFRVTKPLILEQSSLLNGIFRSGLHPQDLDLFKE